MISGQEGTTRNFGQYLSEELHDLNRPHHMRLEVFTVINIQVPVLYVVSPCSYVVGYQSFGGSCWLHLHFITTCHHNPEESNLKGHVVFYGSKVSEVTMA
jgi:hypothetical protein